MAAADIRRLPIPPHSVEAEQAVLGSLMIDQGAWARVSSRIGSADFYRPDHRTIFAAIALLTELLRREPLTPKS